MSNPATVTGNHSQAAELRTLETWGFFLAALAVALAIFAGSLGRRHLYHSNEARFALLAQDILDRGDWLLPRLHGEPYMNKPPLFLWLVAVASLPHHRVTEFTAQLPAALAAAGGVLATALIGARLWTLRVGLVAALILATSFGYVEHAGLVLTDMLLTCFVVFAVYAFYTGLLQRDRRATAVGYGLVGLAVLTKGPVGFLALVVAAAAAFDRDRWSGWRTLLRPLGLGVLGMLLLPFALTYFTRGAGHYLGTVWQRDYLEWITAPGERPASPLFPLGSLFVGTLPWSLLVPLFLSGGRSRFRDDAGSRWILAWLGLLLGVFLLVAAKRDRYLLPLYPAVALLLARRIDISETAGAATVSRGFAALLWVAGCAVAGALFSGVWRASTGAEFVALFPQDGMELAMALLAVATAALIGGFLIWRGRLLPAALMVALTAATLQVIVHVGYPARYNAAHDVPALATRIQAAIGPADQLIKYRYGKLALDFYLDRPVPEVTDPSALRELMGQSRRVLCVVEERQLDVADAGRWLVLDRLVIAGRPVLVVANRGT